MHMKQQQVVNKLVQFLVALVQPPGQKRLGKRQLLAIGPDDIARVAKHARFMASAGGGSAGPSSSPPLTRTRQRQDSAASNASSSTGLYFDVLDQLQRELQQPSPAGSESSVGDGSMMPGTSGLASSGNRPSPLGGPIIADVTDLLDADNHSNHSGGPPSAGSSTGRAATTPFASAATVASPTNPTDQQTLRGSWSVFDYGRAPEPTTVGKHQHTVYVNPDNVGGAGAAPTTMGRAGGAPPTQTQQHASSVVSPTLLQQTQSYFSSPTSHTSQELTDYLSGISHGLDNCRDALSGGNFQLSPDTMNELFSLCEMEDAQQQQQSSLLQTPQPGSIPHQEEAFSSLPSQIGAAANGRGGGGTPRDQVALYRPPPIDLNSFFSSPHRNAAGGDGSGLQTPTNSVAAFPSTASILDQQEGTVVNAPSPVHRITRSASRSSQLSGGNSGKK